MAGENRFKLPTREELDELSTEEKAIIAAAYLGRLEVMGKKPLPLFIEMARLTVLSTVEIVPVRSNPQTAEPEVLLTQRPDSDPWWAGQWHVPGTVIFPTDPIPRDEEIDFDDPEFNPIASYRSPIDRVISGELKDSIRIESGPHLLEARYRAGIRSHESTVMCWAEVNTVNGDEPAVGQFFTETAFYESPPEGGFIVGHEGLVKRAAKAYVNYLARRPG